MKKANAASLPRRAPVPARTRLALAELLEQAGRQFLVRPGILISRSMVAWVCAARDAYCLAAHCLALGTPEQIGSIIRRDMTSVAAAVERSITRMEAAPRSLSAIATCRLIAGHPKRLAGVVALNPPSRLKRRQSPASISGEKVSRRAAGAVVPRGPGPVPRCQRTPARPARVAPPISAARA